MKTARSKLVFFSLLFSAVVILAAVILPSDINLPDPVGFVTFWAIFITHFIISAVVLKRGLLVPLIWSLTWFFGTGLAACVAGIAVHGIP